jgi:flagellar biogenesis protein FliO
MSTMRSLYARPWTISLLGAGLVALCVWSASRPGPAVAADAAAGPEAARPAAAAATTAPAKTPATATSAPTTAPTTAPAGSAGRSTAKLPLRSDRTQGLPTLPDSGSGGVLGKMASYAIVILLLGAAAMVLGKRYLPRLQPAGVGRIQVVDSAYLGPRKQLHVVQIGSQRFLVASCRDSVTMISELASTFAEALEASNAATGTEADTGADGSAGPAGREGQA